MRQMALSRKFDSLLFPFLSRSRMHASFPKPGWAQMPLWIEKGREMLAM
jgi:hypothetical protein